jgi:hypothetical protein
VEAFGDTFVEDLMVAAFEGLPALGCGNTGSAQDAGVTGGLALLARHAGAAGGDEGGGCDAALRALLRAIAS